MKLPRRRGDAEENAENAKIKFLPMCSPRVSPCLRVSAVNLVSADARYFGPGTALSGAAGWRVVESRSAADHAARFVCHESARAYGISAGAVESLYWGRGEIGR